jgi:hypothetical protein
VASGALPNRIGHIERRIDGPLAGDVEKGGLDS